VTQTRLQSSNYKNRYFLKAFLLGIGVSFLFFIPFIIYDQGYFLYYGDFNVQQVPFYQMIHDSIRSGNIFWSWTTDLGANTIGSYSFYLMGSPFFWLTLPFPSEAVPYLMGPLLILKFGCASLTGYIYLRRYVRNQGYGLIGGMLYAFSGFSVYNIFFNHFHEAIIIFPLVLAALDEYMYTRRRGVFAAAVFASCLFNYYFFVGQVVFVIIYWFVRMFAKSWKITAKDFFWLLFESVLGVAGTAVLLFPTILTVTQNPRVDNPPQGWGALLYGWEQRYLHILQSLFFPPDIPARPNFTPDSEAKWASLGAWLPLFSMTGVIAWFQTKRRHWLKRLLLILFLMAMVPILNSAFQLFNSSYYARWFYMLTLMLSLATLMSLENTRVDWKRAIKWTAGITLAIALPIGFMPKSMNGGKETQIGLMTYPDRFWIYVAISMVSLVMLGILIGFLKKDKKRFIRLAAAGCAAVTILYSAYIIGLGKSQSYSTHNFIIPYSLKGGNDINLPDTENCRIDIYNGMDNQAMFWQIPTIQAFHSIVPGSIMEFYPSIGVQRDVGSRPDTSTYGLRGLTSCRWLFDYAGDDKTFNNGTEEYPNPAMPGWTYYDTQNGFDIWENQYYIPYGFTYDSYITRDQYDGVVESNRNLLLLKTIVLDEAGAARNADILEHVEDPKDLYFDQESYFKDCLNRRELTCSSFSRDNTGFTGEITVPEGKDQLVFFSVPYESGWSATVNGQEAVIEKANVGFMAVRVPAGQTSTIRFDYMTPGLLPGLFVTLGCLIIFGGYLLLFRKRKPLAHERLDSGRKLYRVVDAQPVLPEDSVPDDKQDQLP
jgi:uncharacterized membrane protein YfhO